MRIIGTSREGCGAVLVVSGIVGVLGAIGHLNFELNLATDIFIGLNLFAFYGVLARPPITSLRHPSPCPPHR
jgi:hypothetical protein